MDTANRSPDYCMTKLDHLAAIRVKYPYMSEHEMIKLFLELEEFIGVNTGVGIGI